MTQVGVHYMPDDPQLLSRRLAVYVSQVPAKELAARIGCDVRTAENIRKGHWPVARHWMGLIGAFGRDITDAVFHPHAAAERLAREVAELEQQLAAKKRAHLTVAGNGPGVAKAVAPRPRAHLSVVSPDIRSS